MRVSCMRIWSNQYTSIYLMFLDVTRYSTVDEPNQQTIIHKIPVRKTFLTHFLLDPTTA